MIPEMLVWAGHWPEIILRCFEYSSDDHTMPCYFPSCQLAPLATIMLKVKLLDMGDPRSVLSTALSPPNLSDIVRTVLQLKEVSIKRVQTDDSLLREQLMSTQVGMKAWL